MIVRCIHSNIKTVSQEQVKARLLRSINLGNDDPDLKMGHEYYVQALSLWRDGGIRIYLHTVEMSSYPRPYPIELFTMVDDHLPSGWRISIVSPEDGDRIHCIGFSEWVLDDSFYERLVDGDLDAERIYALRRRGPRVK